MRRVGLAVILLLLLAPALPVADAERVFQGRSPVQGSWPLSPQLYWAILYEEAGSTDCVEHNCHVTGPVRFVDQVRIRIVGSGEAFVLLHDNVAERTVTSGRCTASCVLTFPPTSSTSMTLTVISTKGAANTLVEVDVEQALHTSVGRF